MKNKTFLFIVAILIATSSSIGQNFWVSTNESSKQSVSYYEGSVLKTSTNTPLFETTLSRQATGDLAVVNNSLFVNMDGVFTGQQIITLGTNWTSVKTPTFTLFQNKVSYSALASFGNILLVASSATSKGVLACDFGAGTFYSFASDLTPKDIASNGKWLCVLSGSSVYKYNSAYQLVSTILLPDSANGYYGIGLDNEGNIFATQTGSNQIQKFDPQGGFIRSSVVAGVTGLGDIDVVNGQVALGTSDGSVVLTDTSFNSFQTVHVASSGPTFVALTPSNVPEPSIVGLFTVGVILIFAKRRKCLV